MKVLSLREPYASLIKEGIKTIETRSWKTNYRGKLYIHASLGKIKLNDLNTQKLLSYLTDKEMKYGRIIACVNLVDCQYMDEKFIIKINKNPKQKACGLYEVGRYAWLLKDIEILQEPINAKGKLGIWNL